MARTRPVSISDSHSKTTARLADIFLDTNDRRHFALKAITLGVLVAVLGIVVDYLAYEFHLPWFREHIIVNVTQGGLFALFVWVGFKIRLNRRFKEVGYLNHHIRNSLTVISMAETLPESNQRQEIISEATKRIRRCVEKITRNEDCEIDNQSPNQP